MTFLPSRPLLLATSLILAPALVKAQDARDARVDSLRAVVTTLQEAAATPAQLKAAGAAWNSLGHEYRALALYDSAFAVYRRALEVRERIGDTHGVAASTNNIANVQHSAGRLDSAIIYYRRALAVSGAAGHRTLHAALLRNLALANLDSAARESSQRDTALAHLREALAIHRALGGAVDSSALALVLENTGDAYSAADQADSALVYWTAALDVVSRSTDRGNEGWLLHAIGNAHDFAERLDSARAYFRRAARVAARDGEPGDRADALLRVGSTFTQEGISDSANSYFAAALEVAQAAADSSRIGAAWRHLGVEAGYSGAYQLAAGHLFASQAILRAAGDLEGEATTLSSIADYYDRVGKDDSARVVLRTALDIRRQGADTSALVSALLQLAGRQQYTPYDSINAVRVDAGLRLLDEARMLAVRTRDAELAALESFRRSQFLLEHRLRDSSRAEGLRAAELLRAARRPLLEAQALGVVAVTHSAPDSVLHYGSPAVTLAQHVGAGNAERAIRANIGERLLSLAGDGTPPAIIDSMQAHLETALHLARQLNLPLSEARTLQTLGHTYKARSPSQWAAAAAYYDSSWVALERIRQDAGDDATRIAFAEEHLNAARHLASAWAQRAEETGAQADLRRMLGAEERGRARSLLDLVGTRDTVAAGAVEQAAIQLIDRIDRPGRAVLSYFTGSAQLSMTLILPGGRIERYRLPVGFDSLSQGVAILRGTMHVDSAAVRAAPSELEPPLSFAESRGLGAGLGHGAGAGASVDESLAHIAASVLPPELRERLDADGIRELVITTDVGVATVPFAALPYDSTGTPLGARMTLRFTPSLTLFAQAEARPASRGAGGALVVGNPAMPTVTDAAGRRVQLNALPGAEAEARAVARAMGVEARTGSAATERAVQADLSRASLIHLATHGYAYGSTHRAGDSFIALAPGGGEDGLLTMAEVLEKVEPMQADLVVLSACQTALGNSTATEGIVGLQRAFLARGARALLVSLWSVDDAVTHRMMVRFYEHWLGGASMAEALQRAQADIRSTHPEPRYWSAFQLVGAG